MYDNDMTMLISTLVYDMTIYDNDVTMLISTLVHDMTMYDNDMTMLMPMLDLLNNTLPALRKHVFFQECLLGTSFTFISIITFLCRETGNCVQ